MVRTDKGFAPRFGALIKELEGLDKPVVFTGAQIPLSELRSDGRDNIITSMMIAIEKIPALSAGNPFVLCFAESDCCLNRPVPSFELLSSFFFAQ